MVSPGQADPQVMHSCSTCGLGTAILPWTLVLIQTVQNTQHFACLEDERAKASTKDVILPAS